MEMQALKPRSGVVRNSKMEERSTKEELGSCMFISTRRTLDLGWSVELARDKGGFGL